jgi:hypothetical protein
MKQNLGKLDRIFRFVLGVWVLSPFSPWFMDSWPDWLVVVIGLWAIFESIASYCPLHDWLGINNKHQ